MDGSIGGVPDLKHRAAVVESRRFDVCCRWAPAFQAHFIGRLGNRRGDPEHPHDSLMAESSNERAGCCRFSPMRGEMLHWVGEMDENGRRGESGAGISASWWSV